MDHCSDHSGIEANWRHASATLDGIARSQLEQGEILVRVETAMAGLLDTVRINSGRIAALERSDNQGRGERRAVSALLALLVAVAAMWAAWAGHRSAEAAAAPPTHAAPR